MKKIFTAAVLFAAMTACCGGAQTALEGTTWKLAEMEGIPAEAINAGADAFTLKFDAADTLVSGRTNCNRFFGKYEKQDEDAFVRMLDEVDRYEIVGSELKLYDDKTLLAGFRAAAPEASAEAERK